MQGSCRCTIATSTKYCTQHHTLGEITITKDNHGVCHLCVQKRNKYQREHRTSKKEQKRNRLTANGLSLGKADTTVKPKPNDVELKETWCTMETLLVSMQDRMKPPMSTVFYDASTSSSRKRFYGQLAGALGVDGNHYGMDGETLVETMVLWFTKKQAFSCDVVLRKLPNTMRK